MFVNKETAGLTLLGFAETVGTFGNLCPTVDALRDKSRSGDNNLRSDLNAAYVRSGAIGLAIAAAASLFADSPLPFIAGLAGAAVSIANYESELPPEQRLLATPNTMRMSAARPVDYIETTWREVVG